jgi:gliding motility-associated-like protein
MNVKYLFTALFFAAFLFGKMANSQTVFTETFDEGDGATTGTDDLGGVSWTATCPACVGGDYFEITGGALEGLDTNGPADWTSSDIDISSCDKIEISFDLEDIGTMEDCGTGCNSVDWVMLEYNIDGGGWETPPDAFFCAGDCADVAVIQADDIDGGTMTYSTGCIPGGTSMQIRITVQTWAGSEAWRIDNVQIACSDLPSIDAGDDVSVCEGSMVTLTADNPDGADLSWSGGVTDGDAFTPPSGSTDYTVTATDPVGGCVSTDVVTVNVFSSPTAAVTPAGPYTTSSASETLSATPPGGSWSASCGGCINSTTGEFNPAVAGPGTHTICYDVGVDPCDDQDCIDIVVTGGGPCGMAGDFYGSDPTCFGYSDGSVTVDLIGGEAPITFEITNEDDEVVNVDNSNTANSLPEGWYYFEITDNDGCVITSSVFIDDPDSMEIEMNLGHVACHGDATGYAIADTVINAQGPKDLIVYIWSTGENGPELDSIGGLVAGEYELDITDSAGCPGSTTFTITEPPMLEFSEIGYQPAYCRLYHYQSGSGQVYAAATGGTPDYTYLWENLGTGATSVNTTWGGLNPGDYEMTVTDNNGCVLTQLIVLDSLNPTSEFDVVSQQLNGNLEGTATVCVDLINQSMYFTDEEADSDGDSTFWWNFNAPNAQTTLHQDEEYYTVFDTCYTEGGTYDVCLKIQNKNGCEHETCKTITVFDPLKVVPPNIFTPDGDGINDVFTFGILAQGVQTFHCTIVNRWGNQITELNGITDGWNGKDKSGSICRDGTYFYIYEGTSEAGEPFAGQGTVQIIGSGK